jgi:hypothetical protein
MAATDARFLEILQRGDDCLPSLRPFGSRPDDNRPAQGSVDSWIISSATSRPRQSSGSLGQSAPLWSEDFSWLPAVLLEALQVLTLDRHADFYAALFGGALTQGLFAALYIRVRAAHYPTDF